MNAMILIVPPHFVHSIGSTSYMSLMQRAQDEQVFFSLSTIVGAVSDIVSVFVRVFCEMRFTIHVRVRTCFQLSGTKRTRSLPISSA